MKDYKQFQAFQLLVQIIWVFVFLSFNSNRDNSSYVACVNSGLVGNCCPSQQGVMLACCGNSSAQLMSGEFEGLIFADHAGNVLDAKVKCLHFNVVNM
jgi:hypothetical protein